MAKVVNLRQARKRKAREAAEQTAARNRLIFGRSKAQKEREKLEGQREQRRLDEHRRDPGPGDTPA